MTKQRRYILSGGLAFTEQKDMNKLSSLAAEGWLLESFTFLGYYVVKDEPQQLTYCVDYNNVKKNDYADYVELFEASGWTKVCSKERIHIFSAPRGTKPIYTDTDTLYEKYKSSIDLMKPFLVIPVITIAIIALLLFAQSAWNGTLLKHILNTAGALGFVISVPLVITYSAFLIRLNKLKKH